MNCYICDTTLDELEFNEFEQVKECFACREIIKETVSDEDPELLPDLDITLYYIQGRSN